MSVPTVPEERMVEIPETQPEKKESASETGEMAKAVETLITHETGREKTQEQYSEILSKVAPPTSGSKSDDDGSGDIVFDAKHIGNMTDEESKVQKLIDLAGTKGVAHAVKVARSLKDYYALDRMHDELTDKLYQGLLEKGLIEKE